MRKSVKIFVEVQKMRSFVKNNAKKCEENIKSAKIHISHYKKVREFLNIGGLKINFCF